MQKKVTIREKINDDLIDANISRAPKDNSNTGAYLWPVFYWQTVEDIASDQLKLAYKNGVSVFGTDDVMRGRGEGEHLIADSNCFSMLATVTKPRQSFDKDLFIAKLCKRYKLERSKLEVIAGECMHPTKAPLSKRVVEAT